MKHRELGNSGLFVSELGFGAMSLPLDAIEANNIFDAALHAGMNFFDTADLYNQGENEKMIASLLKGRRNDIILATKGGNELHPDGKSWSWNPSKKHLIEAVKNSLHRLETDYIDLYQLHGGTMEDDVDETIDAFESLKKEGLILHYGISSIRPTVIKRFLENSHAVSVMMQYSILDRRPEELTPMIGDYGASLITRGTLAKGILTSYEIPQDKVQKGFGVYEPNTLAAAIQLLAQQTDDLHAAAIHYVLSNQNVATALVGASSTQQLLASIKAYKTGCSAEIIQQIREQTKQHQYKTHRLN